MTGWLASTFGRKRLLMMSVTGFTLASFFCGLAPSLPFLIIFRVIRGACGGGLQPLSQGHPAGIVSLPINGGKPWRFGLWALSWRQCWALWLAVG
jgi:MFS family permease